MGTASSPKMSSQMCHLAHPRLKKLRETWGIFCPQQSYLKNRRIMIFWSIDPIFDFRKQCILLDFTDFMLMFSTYRLNDILILGVPWFNDDSTTLFQKCFNSQLAPGMGPMKQLADHPKRVRLQSFVKTHRNPQERQVAPLSIGLFLCYLNMHISNIGTILRTCSCFIFFFGGGGCCSS